MYELVFEDGSTWEDTAASSYLIERNNEVQFKNLFYIEAGDDVILLDIRMPVMDGVTALEKLNIFYSFIHLPIKKKRITLLKSPHVNKSAREQFELKNYKSIITFSNLPNSTKMLTLLTLNKPKIIVLALG